MRKLCGIVLFLVILVAGCTGSTAPPVEGDTLSPRPEPSSSVPVPAPLKEPVAAEPPEPTLLERMRTVIERWEPYGRDPSDYDWVLADPEGRITLLSNGGALEWPSANRARRLSVMFSLPDLHTALFVEMSPGWRVEAEDIRRTWPNSGPIQFVRSFSVLSRDTYERWPATAELPPFPVAEWPDHVDLYARREGTLAEVAPPHFDFDLIDAQVRQWIGNRLGETLISVKSEVRQITNGTRVHPRMLHVYVTVLAGDTTPEQRLLESARLLAGMRVMSVLQAEEIRYERADSVALVQQWGLAGWAEESRDLSDVGDWLKVDGRSGRQTSVDWIPSGMPEDLPVMLEKREQITGLLPDGSRLLLGSRIQDDNGAALVERTVPADWSWEQVWAQEEAVADQLFAAVDVLRDLLFITRRGDEIEFKLLWRPAWEPYGPLAELAGEPALSGRLPYRAYMYDRYRVVKEGQVSERPD